MILTKIPFCLPNLWAFEMEKDMFLVSVELKFYIYIIEINSDFEWLT
jgi:hypothetical protein